MLVVGTRRQQPACFAQGGADRPIGRVELGVDDRALPAKPCPVFAILAIAEDSEHGFDPVRLAQRKVVLAVVRRHVDEAGAAVGGDEIACEEGARAQEEFGEW